MSVPAKKRSVVNIAGENDEITEGSDENEEESMDGDSFVNEEVQVDFEARTPEGGDAEGIKRMLRQLFLKAHVDVSGLTDLILQQSHIASVIKQSELPEEDVSEEDDDEDPVFGITTVVNLTEKENQEVQCLSQIRAIILDQCTKHGTDQTRKVIHELFNQPRDSGRHVGLILNERLVNIPPQIAAPLLENLSKEIKAAREKKQFSFDHFLFICKVYKLEEQTKTSLVFSKPEDDILKQAAISSFEYSIIGESDYGLDGDWDADDEGMKPFHLVLVIPASKLDGVVSEIRSAFA